jgi:hypothetical protein
VQTLIDIAGQLLRLNKSTLDASLSVLINSFVKVTIIPDYLIIVDEPPVVKCEENPCDLHGRHIPAI